jgi:hypothetical protein
VAGALGAEAEAHAERGPHAHLLRAFEDQIELGGHFEHEDDLQAHLLRIQRQIDELLVFVTIAHDVGLRVVHVGQRGDELRLAAGLEAVVILAAIAGDLLDDLLLLVHLDRIHTAIDALILALCDGGGKAFVQLVDAAAEQITETDEQRKLCAALPQITHDAGE